jgi:hypothetical protein
MSGGSFCMVGCDFFGCSWCGLDVLFSGGPRPTLRGASMA